MDGRGEEIRRLVDSVLQRCPDVPSTLSLDVNDVRCCICSKQNSDIMLVPCMCTCKSVLSFRRSLLGSGICEYCALKSDIVAFLSKKLTCGTKCPKCAMNVVQRWPYKQLYNNPQYDIEVGKLRSLLMLSALYYKQIDLDDIVELPLINTDNRKYKDSTFEERLTFLATTISAVYKGEFDPK